jgi:hypothetical protein
MAGVLGGVNGFPLGQISKLLTAKNAEKGREERREKTFHGKIG